MDQIDHIDAETTYTSLDTLNLEIDNWNDISWEEFQLYTIPEEIPEINLTNTLNPRSERSI